MSRTNTASAILGRYRNVGGASVEVIDLTVTDLRITMNIVHAVCGGHGCSGSLTVMGYPKYTSHPDVQAVDNKLVSQAQEWAQDHATQCRAMDQPGTHPVMTPLPPCTSTDPENPEIACKYPAGHKPRCRNQIDWRSYEWERPEPDAIDTDLY